MPHPVREILAASAIVPSPIVAAIVAFAAVPLFAQTGTGLLRRHGRIRRLA